MSLIAAVKGHAVNRGHALSRSLRMRRHGVPTVSESVRMVSSAGYQLEGQVHRPQASGAWPGILLCPGTNDPGSVFEGWSQPVNAAEVASMGFVVLHFDPAGRGGSWGEEDYGGLEHQDNVRVALRHLAGLDQVDPDRLGVVAISLGIAMACGGLAHLGKEPAVQWLIDWEGPSDREIICAGGRIMVPALGHSLKDEVYWRPREAVRWVGELPCGYLRIQSMRDHAQPGEVRHAARMIQAASSGRLSWFRLNDHAPGLVPTTPDFYRPGLLQANRILLRWIRELSD